MTTIDLFPVITQKYIHAGNCVYMLLMNDATNDVDKRYIRLYMAKGIDREIPEQRIITNPASILTMLKAAQKYGAHEGCTGHNCKTAVVDYPPAPTFPQDFMTLLNRIHTGVETDLDTINSAHEKVRDLTLKRIAWDQENGLAPGLDEGVTMLVRWSDALATAYDRQKEAEDTALSDALSDAILKNLDGDGRPDGPEPTDDDLLN